MKRLIPILILLGLCACTPGGTVRMAYNETSISNNDSVMLAGFAARSHVTDGKIHKPIFTHCLVLGRENEEKVCIISNDLMEISPELSDTIRWHISRKSGLPMDRILMHNIHTHSAPRSGGWCNGPGGPNRRWTDMMIGAVVDNAVKTIKAKGRPFSLEAGKGTTAINANRCEKEGPADHDVFVARFLQNGKPVVSIINPACHPVCMGPKSYELSPDYSGIACERLEKEWGGKVFQLTGASGNMDPARGPEDASYAEECGNALADSLSNLEFAKVPLDGTFELVNRSVELPFRIPIITPEAVKRHADSLSATGSKVSTGFSENVRSWEKEILARFGSFAGVNNTLRYHLHALNLGGVIFFFTDGEPFCEYQQEARAAFPGRTIVFAGYTNGQNSYLPSKRAYEVRKGYEYEIEQMHVYIKAPYPLSERAPEVYSQSVKNTIQQAISAYGDKYNIIPEPVSLVPADGCFVLKKGCGISADEPFSRLAGSFAEQIKIATGISLAKGSEDISIRKVEGLAKEEYRLRITPESVMVEASDTQGAIYGLQSFMQLLPAEVYGHKVARGVKWTAACCSIEDAPAFPYRGIMLDCGRYFMPVKSIYRLLDGMAAHKLNIFHWHFTEDQGWRIEIKKYPRLTEIGSKRPFTADYNGKNPDGTPHEGFYTQEEAKQVVAYAAARGITVVPEIELPGHATAAIASYPWLSCDSTRTYGVATDWGIKTDVFCPSERTFRFLEDVFTELFDIFPSPIYHIGGDECPKDEWKKSEFCRNLMKELGVDSEHELQTYFVRRMDAFLRDHGKTVMGWDEIVDGSAVPGTIVQSYRGHNPAIRAMHKGLDVVMSPNRWCYLDYYQIDPGTEPKSQSLFLPASKVYNYYPVVDSLAALSLRHIKGMECCIWGEYDRNEKRMEYLAWPRTAAAAETAWTRRDLKDFDRFAGEMQKEYKRLAAIGITPCPSYR